MLEGQSVFLTGAPGAGKTYVLNEFIRRAKRQGKDVAVTASTGIAATHIGGSTIHSWSGLGIREFLTSKDRQALSANAKLVKRYNACEILVIDEVSMLHGKRLDMVNDVCKLLRKNPEPFGGLQVILVGDLFQLPPVSRDTSVMDFAHLSDAWQELDPKICYLAEQHRQTGDGLLALLEAMRRGEIDEYHEELLQERMGKKPSALNQVTRLYAHNVDIDTVNNRHLAALSDETREYEMYSKGPAAKVDQLKRSVLAPELLELKTGAEVMFVANNASTGFVNGTRGKVVDFKDDQPVIELATGRRITVQEHSWKLEEDGKVRAEVVQLPLRLAWAITIHKSQGMSLDAAEIDLSKSFTPGMGYVALSRVRSLDGLYLAGINRMALQMHPQIFDFDVTLRKASGILAAVTSDAPLETESVEDDVAAEVANPELLAKLKAWRLKRAGTDHVPAYIIAHDSVLEALAAKPPASQQALLGIKGFGPAKADKYGAELLEIITGEPLKPIDIVKPESGWSSEQDELLKKLIKQQQPLERVCTQLGKDPEEVWQRLQQLLAD